MLQKVLCDAILAKGKLKVNAHLIFNFQFEIFNQVSIFKHLKFNINSKLSMHLVEDMNTGVFSLGINV